MGGYFEILGCLPKVRLCSYKRDVRLGRHTQKF